MKIFWSWQSDTPGKTGRHFVRGALDEAIEFLKQSKEDIAEPDEEARREEMHVDAGRENVKGSPNLADTILEKITNSVCLVADVTPVGVGPPRQDEEGKKLLPKALMNPNVAIEIGWGMAKIPENGFLMVLNTHYGDRSTIPFDLAHKGGPLMYNLPPDATKEQIKKEHNKLRAQFVDALELFLADAKPKAPPFQATATTQNVASFWKTHEPLVHAENKMALWSENRVEFIDMWFYPNEAVYLRLKPTTAQSEPFKKTELLAAAEKRPQVLTPRENGSRPDRNAYGAIAYETQNERELDGFVQFFHNGEIWACSRVLARKIKGTVYVPLALLDGVMGNTLVKLVALMNDHLKIAPPYDVEMGIVGITGGRLGLGNRQESDVIHENEVVTKTTISDLEPSSVEKVVREFIEDLCDVAGVEISKKSA